MSDTFYLYDDDNRLVWTGHDRTTAEHEAEASGYRLAVR